ncbi:AEC family transporter [Rhodovibrionaceae bacterium A322]
MLNALANPILPIFALMAIGLWFGKRGLFSEEQARTLNSFVFYIAQPSLIFLLAAQAPFADYDLGALGSYMLSQFILYAGVALAAWKLGKTGPREALLLGMTVVFVNHLYYVLPIVEILKGKAATAPIEGVIFIDIAVLFCGTITLMEIMTRHPLNPLQIPLLFAKNPALIALVLGLAVNLVGLEQVPDGVLTFTAFAGKAAPPIVLFALGVVMAKVAIFRADLLTWGVIACNVILQPLLVWGLMGHFDIGSSWAAPLIVLAAGPCGAMPFVIALQYQVETDRLTRAILISTFLTLFSLAFMTEVITL